MACKISSGFLLHATLGPFSKLPYIAKKLGLSLYIRRPYYENTFITDDEKEKQRSIDRRNRKAQSALFARTLLKGDDLKIKELQVSDSVLENFKYDPLLKADDLGDAMIHGLYRPFIPMSLTHSAHIKETSKENNLKDFGRIRIISFSPGTVQSIFIICEWSPNEKFCVKLIKMIDTPYNQFFPNKDVTSINSEELRTVESEDRINLWDDKLNEDNFLKQIMTTQESPSINLSKVNFIVIFSRNLSVSHSFQQFISSDIKKLMTRYIDCSSNKDKLYYKAFNSVHNMWRLTGGSKKTPGILHEVWESFMEIVHALQTYMNVKLKVKTVHEFFLTQQ